jgi:hypothetical protein
MRLKRANIFDLTPELDNPTNHRKGVRESAHSSKQEGLSRSSEWQRRRSVCPQTGKRRFRDAKAVKSALRRCQAAGQMERDLCGSSKREERRYYLCPYCNAFHLTQFSESEYAAAYGSWAA